MTNGQNFYYECTICKKRQHNLRQAKKHLLKKHKSRNLNKIEPRG